MKTLLLAAAAVVLTAAAPAPDPAALKVTITTLVGFGTRHTASSPTDPVRGIGAARAWTKGRLTALGTACGCLAVETIGDQFTGPRAPQGVRVEDIVAIQRGTTDPNRVVIVQGHIDSRISDSVDATHDAPGANDDGSGVAVVLEAARLLSREKFPATIVYAVLSGEEQGLWGGAAARPHCEAARLAGRGRPQQRYRRQHPRHRRRAHRRHGPRVQRGHPRRRLP